VSHILRKLDASNRVDAAAIAHRLTSPEVRPTIALPSAADQR
jgi:hypothetical protein